MTDTIHFPFGQTRNNGAEDFVQQPFQMSRTGIYLLFLPGERTKGMIGNYLIKGFVIGIVFGVPVGVVGVLSVQRGLTYGPAAGFMTGMGSSVADGIYACVGVFGITFISDFLLRHQDIICLAGCLAVTAIGIRGVRKAETMEWKAARQTEGSGNLASCFLTSFAIAITNPTAVLSFMAVFSMFRIKGTETLGARMGLIAGIFGGTCLWWFAAALIVSRFRERVTGDICVKMNRIFGILMVLFGMGIGIHMLLN